MNIKRINSIEYAYRKCIREQNEKFYQQQLITEWDFLDSVKDVFKKSVNAVSDISKKVYNKTKDVVKAGVNGIKKCGEYLVDLGKKFVGAIGNWFVRLWDLIKDSGTFLSNLMTKKYGISNFKTCMTELGSIILRIVDVYSFMSPINKAADLAGDALNERVFVPFLESMAQNVEETTNIDEHCSKLTNSMWDGLKNAITKSQSEAETAANTQGNKTRAEVEKLENNEPISESVKHKYKVLSIEEINHLYKEDAMNCLKTTSPETSKIIKECTYELQHTMHNLIIDAVYDGFTPKIIVESILGVTPSNTPQCNLIVENNLLTFKTHNGNLICEETNLKTQNKIIYESDTSFKGKHLIFEDTENCYKKFNTIITEDEAKEATNKAKELGLHWKILIFIATATAGILLSSALTKIFTWLIALVTAGIAVIVDGMGTPCQITPRSSMC